MAYRNREQGQALQHVSIPLTQNQALPSISQTLPFYTQYGPQVHTLLTNLGCIVTVLPNLHHFGHEPLVQSPELVGDAQVQGLIQSRVSVSKLQQIS